MHCRRARVVLIDQGILVPETWDELSLLETRRARAHDPNVGSMSLTICPTVNCNFRCTYCYQHHVGRLMSADVQDRLIAFLNRQQPVVSSLFVTWFGGEPLLGFDVIQQLTPRLRALVPDAAYSAHIITNGSLLTRDISTRLVDLGVESAQVTLDGPRTRHKERRPLARGQSTFDRILEHLREADPRLAFLFASIPTVATRTKLRICSISLTMRAWRARSGVLRAGDGIHRRLRRHRGALPGGQRMVTIERAAAACGDGARLRNRGIAGVAHRNVYRR